jgi:DNA polymerase I
MIKKNDLVELLTTAEQSYKHDFQTVLITTKKDLHALCTAIKQSKLIALNIQGTDFDPMKSSCAGISIAYDLKHVYFIPRHNNENTDSLSLSDVILNLQPIFADDNIEKVMLDGTFHQILAQQLAMPILGRTFDIKIAGQLLDHASQQNSFELLRNFYAKNAAQSYQELITQDNAITTIEHCLFEGIASTHLTLYVKNILQTGLEQQNLVEQFFAIEMPIQNLLMKMQINGISCNKTLLEKLDAQISKDLENLMYQINGYSDIAVDITIASQVKTLLFDTLKLPGKRKFKTLEKADRIQEHDDLQHILMELAPQHPVVPMIIRYLQILFLQQNFLEILPQYINPTTGKIHAFWQQLTDNNHAILCTHPNLQSIPTDSFGYKTAIRDAFVAQENYTVCAIDYDAQRSIKLILLNLDHQIASHKIHGNIIIVTPNQIVLEIKATDLRLFENALLTNANKKDFLLSIQTGKNWQEVSKNS